VLKVGIGVPVPTFSFSLPDEAATERLGAALAQRLRPRDVVALQGGLGVGKTTLARAILRAASGDPGLIVPSPTFTLVEVYDTRRGVFWHFDLYRLEAPEQVFELGWEEARADGIALVEWAERLGGLLPGERLTVTLAMEGDGRRAELQGDARFGDF
jgi:tRNA threonylcarbamoyladenosine biosynthesis protein TsaE